MNGEFRLRRLVRPVQTARAVLIVLFVVLTIPGRAQANSGVIPVKMAPDNEGGAFIPRPTVLVVEHEDLALRCDATACEFTAVYHLLNPSDAREHVLGAFYGVKTDRFSATMDGVDVRHPLTPEQLQSVDAVVVAPYCHVTTGHRRVCEDPPKFDGPGASAHSHLVREGFLLGVDAHGRATLVFSGRMRPVADPENRALSNGYGNAAIDIRHLWLGAHATTDADTEYFYALWPIRYWGGYPDIDVTVRCQSERVWPSYQRDWTVGHDGSGFFARRTIAAQDVSTSMLAFRISRPGTYTQVLPGGPLVGVGGRLDVPQFRARVGYEAAFPWWLVWSASVEANFKGTATIIPMGEVTTPDIWVIIPSLGLGAGVPVQIRSGAATQVGARLQLTVSRPVLSIVLPVDVFPGAASADTWQVGLFGQASF